MSIPHGKKTRQQLTNWKSMPTCIPKGVLIKRAKKTRYSKLEYSKILGTWYSMNSNLEYSKNLGTWYLVYLVFTYSVSFLLSIPFRKCHIFVVIPVTKCPLLWRHVSPWWISNIVFQYAENVVINHPVIKTVIPMDNKSSTEMFVNISRDVFGYQLLIWFPFQ